MRTSNFPRLQGVGALLGLTSEVSSSALESGLSLQRGGRTGISNSEEHQKRTSRGVGNIEPLVFTR